MTVTYPNPRSVCVTGAGGFIGSSVVRRLSKCVDDLSALVAPIGTPCIEPDPDVRSARGQIDDLETITSLINGAEVVVHLAGPPSVAGSFRDPIGYVRSHTLGTATVLEACRRTGVARVVYVSSAEVYGQPESQGPVDELCRTEARSPYAAAKIGAENLVRAYSVATSTNAVILRLFSVYGPDAFPQSLVPTILRQARTASWIELFDPNGVRDYCYVEDVVDAVERACIFELPQNLAVYNIGTGVATSARSLARIAIEILGRDIPIRTVEWKDRPRNVDIRSLVANPRLARMELNWQASTNLSDGLKLTMAAFEQRS